jgi:hypothetical protein
MPTMHAAVVTTFDEPPHYQQYEVPKAEAIGETLVDVLAVGLHPRVRSGAAGSHYTSTATLPMIPGVDGVGRRPDGTVVYFVAGDGVNGTMAERAVIDPRRAIELPADVDVAKVAAAMNPAMSSWVALRRRVPLTAGQSVLILGATGSAGTMAVQIAARLGAGRVVAAGRDRDRLNALTALGADELVQLTDGSDAADEALAIAATHWTGSRSARSPDPPSSCPRCCCARPICAYRASAKARSRRPSTATSSHHSRPRSTPARSRSTPERPHSRTSSASGAKPSFRVNAPCSSHDVARAVGGEDPRRSIPAGRAASASAGALAAAFDRGLLIAASAGMISLRAPQEGSRAPCFRAAS